MTSIANLQSYSAHWHSIPFLLATLGVLAAAGYIAVIQGAPLLRASFISICSGIIPITASFTLVSATNDPKVAVSLYRFGFALMPVAAVGHLAFASVLSEQTAKTRGLFVSGFFTALALAVPFLTTDWFIRDTWRLAWGMLVPLAGPLFPLYAGFVAISSAVGIRMSYQRMQAEQSPPRRRQLRYAVIAMSAFAGALADIALVYGIGIYPVSWLFCTLGVGLLCRTLLREDLLRDHSIDRRSLLGIPYLFCAGLGIWVTWQLADELPPLWLGLLNLSVYILLRIIIALIRVVQEPYSTVSDTPLDRLIARYLARIQRLNDSAELAKMPAQGAIDTRLDYAELDKATGETLRLGLGCETIKLLLPSSGFGFETVDKEPLPEDAIPDPLMYSWLLDHGQPIQRMSIPGMRLGDYREPMEALFTANGAEVMVPLVNHDDMVGLLILGGFRVRRALSGEELRFVQKVQEHLTAALVYSSMRREANAQVAMLNEVQLAAAVQSAFVPSADLAQYGSVQISGLWAPAMQCGGDWWSVHELPDGRVLVLIGDVTGHGVAAAMVTAAAKGCYDVAQKLMQNDLDLVRLLELLDASVRTVGADQFHMTCFATLLDPKSGTVAYANAGHVVPYTCRPQQGGGIKVSALVSRGNPLGAGDRPRYRSHTRDLLSGDFLVWYTDGIVECTDPDKQQFGERRLQRLLRRIDTLEPNAKSVRDHIALQVVAFRRGQQPDDDITLVVARIT